MKKLIQLFCIALLLCFLHAHGMYNIVISDHWQNDIKIFNQDGKLQKTLIETEQIIDMDISNDFSKLVSLSISNMIKVWEVKSGEVIRTYTTVYDDTELDGRYSKFNQTSNKIYIITENGTLLTLNTANKKILPKQSLSLNDNLRCLTITKDRKNIVCFDESENMYTFNIKTNKNIQKEHIPLSVNNICVSPNNLDCAFFTNDNDLGDIGTVQIRKIKKLNEKTIIAEHGEFINGAFSNNGELLAYINNDYNKTYTREIKVVSIENKKNISTIKTNKNALCLAFNPSDDQLTIGIEDGTIEIWDITNENAKKIKTMRAYTSNISNPIIKIIPIKKHPLHEKLKEKREKKQLTDITIKTVS